MTSAVMYRRNKGLLSAFTLEQDNVNMRPGDPAYSPTDVVTQSPVQYGSRSEAPDHVKAPTLSPGWWNKPTAVNPSQYIDQNVGGVAGDTKRLGWSVGLSPFTQFRQPFTGTVLTPPRPTVLVVGRVGRLGQRDTLAARVAASTADYQPSAAQVAQTMVNPQLGW
jgi:hypothetical protein